VRENREKKKKKKKKKKLLSLFMQCETHFEEMKTFAMKSRLDHETKNEE